MAERNYPPAVRAALWAVSSMSCYYPGCDEPTVMTVDGEPEINVDIAHIHGLNEKSARFRHDMTDEQRNAFSNLILLCRPHHRRVDRLANADRYPAQVLHAWKQEQEGGRVNELERIRGLSIPVLRQMLVEIDAERSQRLETLVERLEATAPADAAVLRELLVEVRALRGRRAVLDPDMVRQFTTAARAMESFPAWVKIFNRTVERWLQNR